MTKATLKVGWWVGLTLRPDTAPLPVYVGQIEALDERGVRMTMVDFITGMATGYDLYVPWTNIETAVICTEEHDAKSFGEYAGRWQQTMEKRRSGKGE